MSAPGAAPALGTLAGRVVPRDVVTVSGPDAESYLQGQCTQDLEGMAAGEARRSFVLTPQGKVVVLTRVTRRGDGSFLFDVNLGHGEALLERLRRFKLRVKAEMALETWRCAELRALSPPSGEEPAPGEASEAGELGEAAGAGGVVLPVEARLGGGIDLLGPEAALPAGVALGDEADFEALRIEWGVPRMGSELDERVIPQETGLAELTVSFTKGCYTGQELVARLDARGTRVPRLLRGVLFPPAAGSEGLAPAGSELVGEGGEKALATLTSVGYSPRLRRGVALAWARREVVVPARLSLSADPTGAPLEVLELPLAGGAD